MINSVIRDFFGIPYRGFIILPLTTTNSSSFDFITRTGNTMNVNITNTPPVRYFYNNANVNETRNLKQGAGKLIGIVINNPTAGTIDIYNSLTGTGSKIASISVAGSVPFYLKYDLNFSIGLTYVHSTSAGDFTIIFE